LHYTLNLRDSQYQDMAGIELFLDFFGFFFYAYGNDYKGFF